MQPLPTEATPRSVCAHCGEPLPPPNGSATFVYGVGAVGYQSCTSCGAKWRYLWQDLPVVRVKPDRSRRAVVVFGAAALAVLLIVGAFALARSQRWNRGSDTTTVTRPVSTSVQSGSQIDPKTQAEFVVIAELMSRRREGFVRWVANTATATPQYQVDERANGYIDAARAELDVLRRSDWPSEVAAEIDALIAAGQKFVDDLDPIFHGQANSPSYVSMIRDDARAVQHADDAVREKLGIPSDSQ